MTNPTPNPTPPDLPPCPECGVAPVACATETGWRVVTCVAMFDGSTRGQVESAWRLYAAAPGMVDALEHIVSDDRRHEFVLNPMGCVSQMRRYALRALAAVKREK